MLSVAVDSQTALQRETGWKSRFQLRSLYEMLDFCAEPYTRVVRLFGELGIQLSPDQRQLLASGFSSESLKVNPMGIRYFMTHLSQVQYDTYREDLLRFPLSNRLREQLGSFWNLVGTVEITETKAGEFSALANQLADSLINELKDFTFLMVPASYRALYEQGDLLFGQTVIDQFPSAAFDIEEAGKCLALNRYTASVYHLMRIAEAALASIAKRVGLVNDRPGWDECMTYIEGQLRKRREELNEIFKGDVDFLSETVAHMRSVNIAWRRRVAHIESKYTEEEAIKIYDATRALMQHIAGKLTEVGLSA